MEGRIEKIPKHISILKNTFVGCPYIKNTPVVSKCSGWCFTPGCPKQIKFELKVVKLVNAQREKAGFSPLRTDLKLTRAAREKSKDMAVNKYFSHISPTHGSPFKMMKVFGVSYRCAGENIASGYVRPETVVLGWMNSSGHRANILKPKYTHIGVGYYYTCRGNFNHYWTQQFIEWK